MAISSTPLLPIPPSLSAVRVKRLTLTHAAPLLRNSPRFPLSFSPMAKWPRVTNSSPLDTSSSRSAAMPLTTTARSEPKRSDSTGP